MLVSPFRLPLVADISFFIIASKAASHPAHRASSAVDVAYSSTLFKVAET
jgi:hypothetical protein